MPIKQFEVGKYYKWNPETEVSENKIIGTVNIYMREVLNGRPQLCIATSSQKRGKCAFKGIGGGELYDWGEFLLPYFEEVSVINLKKFGKVEEGVACEKFVVGRQYKWVGPKKRPDGWDLMGAMDFMLDGKWHLCTQTVESYSNRAGFDDSDVWCWWGLSNFREQIPGTQTEKVYQSHDHPVSYDASSSGYLPLDGCSVRSSDYPVLRNIYNTSDIKVRGMDEISDQQRSILQAEMSAQLASFDVVIDYNTYDLIKSPKEKKKSIFNKNKKTEEFEKVKFPKRKCSKKSLVEW